ncbi:MAG: tRNA (adenosine(37)-N6)-threonylcarbamoyltransferase complex ATPase subunit type 1 TsaE [Chitinophagaceae bacterium]
MTLQYTLDQITEAATKFWGQLGDYRVFAFYGQMGAGKTTFIHALCEVLKVKDVVSSPTFSIINEYATENGKTVYHLDLYRLKDEEEALQAGVEDVLYSESVCLIEWPQKAEDLLPEHTVKVEIEILSEKERNMKLTIPA